MGRALLATAILTVALTTGAALADPPPDPTAATLTGETLHGEGGTTFVSCSGIGTGSVSYGVTGAAVGPYPGTFTEKGFVTLKGGKVVGFKATFSIDSAAGEVHGSKVLLKPGSAAGTCVGDTASVSNAPLKYSATIVTRDGIFSDSGTSRATLTAVEPSTVLLDESFVSALDTATLVLNPPGNSFPIQPGQGCGDANHLHEDADLCALPDALEPVPADL